MAHDIIYIGCQECGNTIALQSTAGLCKLNNYMLQNVPPAVAMDLHDTKGRCSSCGWSFVIKTQFIVSVFPTRESLL